MCFVSGQTECSFLVVQFAIHRIEFSVLLILSVWIPCTCSAESGLSLRKRVSLKESY